MSDLKLKSCPICNAEMEHTKTPRGYYRLADKHEPKCALKGASCASYSSIADLAKEWSNRPHENKLKAEAVREFGRFCSESSDDEMKNPDNYANKLERGEL